MKKQTKKLVKELEKIEVKFDLTEGESEENSDRIEFAFAGNLINHDIGIVVASTSVTIFTFLINAVKEEKYRSLLETLNELNFEYNFVKFYASKNNEEEGYCVMVRIDSLYGDNYVPEETIDLIGIFVDILEEAYPQIIKAIV